METEYVFAILSFVHSCKKVQHYRPSVCVGKKSDAVFLVSASRRVILCLSSFTVLCHIMCTDGGDVVISTKWCVLFRVSYPIRAAPGPQ